MPIDNSISKLRPPKLPFAPDEWRWVFVVGGCEGRNGLNELLDTSEACIVQCLSLEDAEPNSDLVKPILAGGREVKGNVDLQVCVKVGNDFVHEYLEVGAFFGLRCLASDNAGGDFRGSEQITSDVPLTGARLSRDGLNTSYSLSIPNLASR